jgi:hypothetical protein
VIPQTVPIKFITFQESRKLHLRKNQNKKYTIVEQNQNKKYTTVEQKQKQKIHNSRTKTKTKNTQQ